MLEFRAVVSFDDSHDTWTSSPSVTSWDSNRQKAFSHVLAYTALPGFKGAKIQKREVGQPEDDEFFMRDELAAVKNPI